MLLLSFLNLFDAVRIQVTLKDKDCVVKLMISSHMCVFFVRLVNWKDVSLFQLSRVSICTSSLMVVGLSIKE